MDYYDLPIDRAFLISAKALLIKNKEMLAMKYPGNLRKVVANKWGVPGGLLEIDEKIEDGLKREVIEEAGLEMEVVGVIAVGNFEWPGFVFKNGEKKDVRIIEICYLCINPVGKIKLSEEQIEYKWVTQEDARGLEYSADSKVVYEAFLKMDESILDSL